MPLLTLNLSCENVKYPVRKHFEKTNTTRPIKTSNDAANEEQWYCWCNYNEEHEAARTKAYTVQKSQ